MHALVAQRDEARAHSDVVSAERDGVAEELRKLKTMLPEFQKKMADLVLANRRLQLQMEEAREQCKTTAEIWLCEADADGSGQRAGGKAVASLQAELVKSKSLEDELQSVKAQRDTAKNKMARVANFYRQQEQIGQMLASQSFLNLKDGTVSDAENVARDDDGDCSPVPVLRGECGLKAICNEQNYRGRWNTHTHTHYYRHNT